MSLGPYSVGRKRMAGAGEYITFLRLTIQSINTCHGGAVLIYYGHLSYPSRAGRTIKQKTSLREHDGHQSIFLPRGPRQRRQIAVLFVTISCEGL